MKTSARPSPAISPNGCRGARLAVSEAELKCAHDDSESTTLGWLDSPPVKWFLPRLNFRWGTDESH